MKLLIKKYINEDIVKLALKQNNKIFRNFTKEEFHLLITQIAVRQKLMQKFPILASNYDFIFASNLAAAQASSEFTARYKTQILDATETTLDLTGGLGIDSFYFSTHAHIYCDTNATLCKYFIQNCELLNIRSTKCHNISAEEFVSNCKQQGLYFDLLFVDPSRRQNNTKTFMLADSAPDICRLQADFAAVASHAIIKLSPMFDIKQALRDIKSVAQVHVVSVDNDCKELLLVCNYKNKINSLRFVATNITTVSKNVLIDGVGIDAYIKSVQKLEYEVPANEAVARATGDKEVPYSSIGKYLFEPTVSVMKLNCWEHLCKRYNLQKVHSQSHLFTRADLMDMDADFPGVVYEVLAVLPYSKPHLQVTMGLTRANVKCRNFPDTVEAVKKKLCITDGGNYYLFATTDITNKPIIVVSKKV